MAKYLIQRYVRLLTTVRSSFRDRKRSGCLKCVRASISLERKRGYSKALAT